MRSVPKTFIFGSRNGVNSYTIGSINRTRPFSTGDQIELLPSSKKSFDSERSDWRIQSNKVVHSTGCASRISQSKTLKMNPSTSHHNDTRTLTHKSYPVPQTASYNIADAGLAAIIAAASRRKSAWHLASPARQRRVSYDGRWQQRGIDDIFPTTVKLAAISVAHG